MRASTRSRAACAPCWIAVRPAPFGQLRQRDQQGRFRHGQPLRLLAEIGERGGAHAFEIAAIGRQRQVAFEDLALGQPPLDLHARAAICLSLAPSAAASRAARSAAPPASTASSRRRRCGRCRRTAGGARQRQQIDALVLPEALVLIGDQHVDELRIDLVDAGRRAASARPASRRRAAAARRGRPLRAETVEPFRQRRRIGAVERVQARREASPQAQPATMASRRAGQSRARWRRCRAITRSNADHSRRHLHHAGRRAGRDTAAGTCPRRSPPGGRRCRASRRAPHRRA